MRNFAAALRMLIPEITSSEADKKASARGRKEYARGATEEWSEARKRAAER